MKSNSKRGKKKQETGLTFAGVYSAAHEKLILKNPSQLTPGERLRRERYLRFMTLDEMAELLEVSPSYLGAIERGTRAFSRIVMERCHTSLGLSYNYLMDGDLFPAESVKMMVQETPEEPIRTKLNALLSTCTPRELEICYHLFYTYLYTSREKPRKK